jgi:hypothetical protein
MSGSGEAAPVGRVRAWKPARRLHRRIMMAALIVMVGYLLAAVVLAVPSYLLPG